MRQQLDQQLSHKLRQQLRQQLDHQLNNQLDEQLYQQLNHQLNNQLRDQLDQHLRQQLCQQLDDQLRDQLDQHLRQQLCQQLDDQLSQRLHQLDQQLRQQLRQQLDQQLSQQLRQQLRQQLHHQLSQQLRQQLRQQLHHQLSQQLDHQLDQQLSTELEHTKLNRYCGVWWNAWAGWYEGAQVLGVKFDKLDTLVNWAKLCPVWMWDRRDIFILRRPKEICWEDGELHNESGPSVTFSEYLKMWAINGVTVDEQIVMQPETQTIQQINDEENEEVRRIRIERFGVMRYLEESESKVIDSRRNEIENTYEILVDTPQGQRLVTHCPSTGRRYFLSLPDPVETCEQAQRALWGVECNIIGRT